jgi:hypothetical protein
MYIPANLLRTLNTPESLAYEVKRRKLKAALSDAAYAVKSHTAPKLGLGLTAKEMRTFDILLAKEQHNAKVRDMFKEGSPEMKRYRASEEYYLSIVTHRAEHEKLRKIEADARAAYHAYITPSDLE